MATQSNPELQGTPDVIKSLPKTPSKRCERCKEPILDAFPMEHEFCLFKEAPNPVWRPYSSFSRAEVGKIYLAPQGAKPPSTVRYKNKKVILTRGIKKGWS